MDNKSGGEESEKRTLNINISINGFCTVLRINPDEEEAYRRAKKLLEERLNVYTKRFSSFPYNDILHMVAYEFAVEYCKLEQKQHSAPLDTMKRLTDVIDAALGKNNAPCALPPSAGETAKG
ncbi:MAG: cell division protein ZapA [bacterium]|uniref:Cell division protein ZapA n=1 Tax=Candidatus Aphodosoma intestinipullorum TaxID=2840674 RepID=A0A940DL71_9BACT|nr:cell division protein ZapA [Candidatus Aphodosoma intestinipullorum]